MARPRRVYALLAGALLLGGCAGRDARTAREAAPPGEPAVWAGMVTDAGGIDDRSFNASAWAGLNRAREELKARIEYLESKEQSDYETNLSILAEQGPRLVFAVGYLMEDALAEVAPRYPEVKFAIIDGSAPNLPNCAALKFREEEGAFLAGYLAGRMTKTGGLGFVGGVEGPLIKKFECGYRAGARTARPDVRVIVKYVGGWTDVAKGKELALLEYAQGADIVFHATGKAGLGVLDAAAEKGPGYYAIGVDRDQDEEHPGRVLTSVMKGVDTAVFDTVKALAEGRWQRGDHVLGVREGAVRLSPMRYTRKDVPQHVLDALDRLTREVAAGRVAVPKTEEEVQNFVPPKV
ncbi:MAG: BMP family ABC transporter substrate-binding protein [Chthonomonadales bacterium]|nr:BMP family ABC transporter substrate-binding protein [Chthonomonadales bacterium]